MVMSEKSHRQLTAKAELLIQPGERIVHTLYAKAGTVPIKKNLASIAASVAVGAMVTAVTGGTGMVMVNMFDKARVYIAVTDRSLLIFAGRRNRSGPGDLVAHVPREVVTATVLSNRVAYKLRLDFAGSDQALRLTFAPLPRGLKDTGRYLAALLQQPTSTGESESRRRRE
ncbi:hypothetical protein [Nonomuraea sediminis]|uniref:hypothetical protein n=1 Tax=Nonomuraea sediminis TaxID=2835864 RepID=UPI001BDC37AD|nr:hypothetical protein [Nonomuraea sediminis]